MGIKCGTCLYFDGEATTFGHCRKYAPRPELGSVHELASVHFPYLHATQWCGEWTDMQDLTEDVDAFRLEGNEEAF